MMILLGRIINNIRTTLRAELTSFAGHILHTPLLDTNTA